jgi:hypothetical protein
MTGQHQISMCIVSYTNTCILCGIDLTCFLFLFCVREVHSYTCKSLYCLARSSLSTSTYMIKERCVNLETENAVFFN